MLGILNGNIYDPLNKINAQQQDIWIRQGRIVAPEAVDRQQAKIIDAAGLVVMPGGVDIHSHIVGAKVNAGRKLRPEDHRRYVRERTDLTRSGSGYTVPTTYLLGYRYAEMGYTTVMEAATAPLVARHTHEELEDTPILDKGVFITMGNNHFIMKCIRDGKLEQARDYVACYWEQARASPLRLSTLEEWKTGNGDAT